MTGANAILRAVIVQRYDYLMDILKRRLRSQDLAQEALHDAYLHFGKGKEQSEIGNPVGFVLHAAVNIARDRQRADRRRERRVSSSEIDTALEIADDAPDPARAAEAKSDWLLLEKALAELPERRRAIFLISLREKAPAAEIAKRFGRTKRWVNSEIKLAREHCARVLLNNSPK